MKNPHYMHTPKTLENGKPNPAYYEELVELVSEILPNDSEPTIEECVVCGKKGSLMFEYKKKGYYMECSCGILSDTLRETKHKAISAWNIRQLIKKLD